MVELGSKHILAGAAAAVIDLGLAPRDKADVRVFPEWRADSPETEDRPARWRIQRLQ